VSPALFHEVILTYRFIGLIDKSAARRGIIVHPDKLGSAARKTLQEMSTEYGLEEFSESDLLVNITKHFLVPKHSIMSTEEKVALIKK
jgi:DNA-directed RNA polymerase I, II, and III subunit RPABC1